MATRNRSMPSNVRNFGATPPAQVPRSTFNLSKPWKGTFDAGELVPFYVSEGLPGDTRKVRVSAIARLATPIKPIMDNVYLDFHFWWCPLRQLHANFVKMMGEQENPGDSIDFLTPVTSIVNTTQAQTKKLFDWMGVPVDQIQTIKEFNALPGRMYNRVYNFHYRDQNLINQVYQTDGDGPDSVGNYVVLKRGKRHDYLTASLPFQQKGSPVQLPLGSEAPVFTDAAAGSVALMARSKGSASVSSWNLAATPGDARVQDFATGATNIKVDLAGAVSASITDLRQSIALQHVLERDARSGSRYPEILLSRYRVLDPQMLVLQRPEYLGGGTQRVTVSPVPQTTATPQTPTSTDAQGNLAAVGVSMVSNIGFTRSFTEFGYLMGIVSARADLTYQQGMERHWFRRSRFDYYHPELAHISEQAVLSEEIYSDGSAGDKTVWGYIGAYDELRYGVGLVTGLFRSKNAAPLDVWHLSQNFAERPTLNQTFIEENPPIDRVIAVQNEPHFIMDCWIEDIAARPLPLSGIPGLSRI